MPTRFHRASRRIRNWVKSAGWAIIGFLVAILVLGMAYAVIELVHQNTQAAVARSYLVRQQKSDTKVLEELQRQADQITDCTQPGGRCFKQSQVRSQKRAIAISGNILRIGVAITSCERDGFVNQVPLTRCAISRLKSTTPLGLSGRPPAGTGHGSRPSVR